MYEVTQSAHNMPCIQAHDLSVEECRRIRAHVMDNRMDSKWYKAAKKAGAFLQGYEEKGGWVLVEFWQPDHEEFVNMLNEELKNAS